MLAMVSIGQQRESPMTEAIRFKSIVDILVDPFMKRLYQWVFAIAVVITAFTHTNLAPLIAAVLAFLWYWLAATLSEEGVLFEFTLQYRYKNGTATRNRYFKNTSEWAAVIGVPLLLAGLSTFLFIPFFYDYQVLDRAGGGTDYRRGMFVTTMNPFSDTVRNYSADQTLGVGGGRDAANLGCIAKTNDGRGVRGVIGAALTLPFEGVRAAHEAARSEKQLVSMVKGALCGRFESVIASYRLEQIPTLLTIESKTLDERRSMNDLGVQYSGEITVLYLRAYAL